MTYLQKKKLAFMSIVNSVKGFVRKISGVSPLILPDCVDEDSLINYQIKGNCVQNGSPTPDNVIEVESVGDKTKNLLNPDYFTYKAINGSNVWSNTYNKWVFIKAGTTYKFSIKKLMNCSSWRINFALFDSNKEYISNTTGATAYTVNNYLSSIVCSSNTSMGWYQSTVGVFIMNGNITSGTSNIVITFTPKSDLYISFYINSGDTTSNTYAVEPQIEEGKTVTEYEPYNKYKIPVKCSGKNLLNLPYTTDNRLISAKNLYAEFSFPVEIGKTYTFTFKARNSTENTSSLSWALSYNTTYTSASSAFYYRTQWWDYFCTFTATQNKVYFIGGVKATNEYWDFQLEEGTTATDYEPYVEPVQKNIYIDAPLRKASNWGATYSDYIDFKNQKLIRRIGTYILAENYFSGVTESNAYKHVYKYEPFSFYGFRFMIGDMLKATRICGYCNTFRVDGDDKLYLDPYGMWLGVTSDRVCYFCLPEIYNAGTTDYERVLALNEWLKGREPIRIYYILDTAKETSIDLLKLPTFKGTTIYTIGTTTQPSDMRATYYATSKE